MKNKKEKRIKNTGQSVINLINGEMIRLNGELNIPFVLPMR
jgi:hypothetical protein